MKVALFNKKLNNEHISTVCEFARLLKSKNIEVYWFKTFYWSLMKLTNKDVSNQTLSSNTFETFEEILQINPDFIISMGGDGTILDCIKIVKNSNIPIVGVNLGRLGFLANIEPTQLEHSIDCLISGMYQLDTRSLLQLESERPMFEDFNYALNDCTILKRDTSSMVTIHTYINGEFLNSYWADGLIISTPTGSTGYSLSCGGPIVFPSAKSLILTPVAPHNLNVRPLVVSDDVIISLEVEGRAKTFLCTLDARYATITSSDLIAIKRADFTINLVRFSDRNFLSTIREKLNWGADSRN